MLTVIDIRIAKHLDIPTKGNVADFNHKIQKSVNIKRERQLTRMEGTKMIARNSADAVIVTT
jgi:hypothetical protein